MIPERILSYTLPGETNPALCALKVLRVAGQGQWEINEQSFHNVAHMIDVFQLPQVSFMVRNTKDLEALCNLGNFHIAYDRHGRLTARKNREVSQ